MRKAILSLGGNAVEVITVSPVSGSSLVTVFVKLRRDKLAAVMSAITDLVPSSQFGPYLRPLGAS